MPDHVLGIDVGLTGVRAAVVRQDGELLGGGRRDHTRAVLAEGRAEHDPADWLDGMAAATHAALARAGGVRPAALGIAALGPAPVLVDRGLEPLTPALLFSLDRRAEPQRRGMVGDLSATAALATGDNALPKLAWWREHVPEVFARAAWGLDATGFLVGWCTGVPVMDTVTAADYALPGVRAPVPLPVPIAPTALAGRLRERPARRLGLEPGLPVTAGTYDSFADLAAAGVRAPGDAGIVLGSTVIIARVAAGTPAPPPGLASATYPGDGILLGGWTLSGGSVLDWCARTLGDDRRGNGLAAAAAHMPPGAGGLVALPFFAGERTPVWDADASGLVLGLTLRTRPAELYRALVDALALAAGEHAERLAQALGPCPRWRVTGGGTRNPTWLQATADVLGAPLDVAAAAGEAMGPALLALRALGHDPARPAARTVAPDPARQRRCSALAAIYRDLHPRLAPAMHALRHLDRDPDLDRQEPEP